MIYYLNVFKDTKTGRQFIAKTKHRKRETADDRARLVDMIEPRYQRQYCIKVDHWGGKLLPEDPTKNIGSRYWFDREAHKAVKVHKFLKNQRKFKRK